MQPQRSRAEIRAETSSNHAAPAPHWRSWVGLARHNSSLRAPAPLARPARAHRAPTPRLPSSCGRTVLRSGSRMNEAATVTDYGNELFHSNRRYKRYATTMLQNDILDAANQLRFNLLNEVANHGR